MAKRTSGVRAERFVNRWRGEITSGANATTVVTMGITTGMNVGRADSFKWVVLGASLMPKHDEVDASVVAATTQVQALRAQLCIGTQTAFLDGDDMQVIAEACRSSVLSTNGQVLFDWPLRFDIDYPLPVFGQALTLLVKGWEDNSSMQNVTYTFTLWYVAAGISQGEIVEYLAAYGQV